MGGRGGAGGGKGGAGKAGGGGGGSIEDKIRSAYDKVAANNPIKLLGDGMVTVHDLRQAVPGMSAETFDNTLRDLARNPASGVRLLPAGSGNLTAVMSRAQHEDTIRIGDDQNKLVIIGPRTRKR